MDWPSRWDLFSARMRAITSVPPPGAKPTSTLTGLSGNFAVCARASGVAMHAASTSPSRRRSECIDPLLWPNGLLPFGLVVQRYGIKLEPVIDQTVAEPARHFGLQRLDFFRLEFDHLAGTQVDQMVVVGIR